LGEEEQANIEHRTSKWKKMKSLNREWTRRNAKEEQRGDEILKNGEGL
jgi:hypothetical protein